MSLLCNNAELAEHFDVNCSASFPEIYSIDNAFNFRDEMVPPPNHYDYKKFLRHYECVEKVIASRLRKGMDNNDFGL